MPAEPPVEMPLHVITYNAQFLPPIARQFNKRPDVRERARQMARRLAAYDIVGLNEMFDPEPRDILLGRLQERLGTSYHSAVAPRSGKNLFGIDGGLAMVSRLPIADSAYLRFGNNGRPVAALVWADGVAAKGAMHTRLEVCAGQPGRPARGEIDLFVTHLESRDAEVRTRQYGLLASFLADHSAAARPLVLMGDMNTDGGPREQARGDSQYHRLMKALRDALPKHTLDDPWRQVAGHITGTSDPDAQNGGRRIDYILVANPKAAGPRIDALYIRANRMPDDRGVPLSDHAAVEAGLLVQLKP